MKFLWVRELHTREWSLNLRVTDPQLLVLMRGTVSSKDSVYVSSRRRWLAVSF